MRYVDRFIAGGGDEHPAPLTTGLPRPPDLSGCSIDLKHRLRRCAGCPHEFAVAAHRHIMRAVLAQVPGGQRPAVRDVDDGDAVARLLRTATGVSDVGAPPIG